MITLEGPWARSGLGNCLSIDPRHHPPLRTNKPPVHTRINPAMYHRPSMGTGPVRDWLVNMSGLPPGLPLIIYLSTLSAPLLTSVHPFSPFALPATQRIIQIAVLNPIPRSTLPSLRLFLPKNWFLAGSGWKLHVHFVVERTLSKNSSSSLPIRRRVLIIREEGCNEEFLWNFCWQDRI